MNMKNTCLLLTALLATSNAFSNQVMTDENVYGIWLESDKQKVAVLIEACGQQLCGKIVWLKKPYTKDGRPKLDHKNPEKSLRQIPRCGLNILTGFSKTEQNHWSGGTIYNPSDGDTYRSTIQLTETGSLHVRGYVGIPLFGMTTTWIRPDKDLKLCL